MKEKSIYSKTRYVLTLLIFAYIFLQANLYSQEFDQEHHQMNDSTMMHRQHQIHSNSSMVMPFDMDKVMHYFIKSDSGGVIMIKAKESNDTSQIGLIRKHLKEEYALFSNADFRDPKMLHGNNMPGLKILSESKGKYDVEYQEISEGAELIFSSKINEVINAIHEWFDAQIKDHGKDAKSNLN